jgi:hypothetical protein
MDGSLHRFARDRDAPLPGDARAQRGRGSLFVLVGYTFAPVAGLHRRRADRPLLCWESFSSALLNRIVHSSRGAPYFFHLLNPICFAVLDRFCTLIVARKKWAVARGFAATLLAATCVVLLFDPAIFNTITSS